MDKLLYFAEFDGIAVERMCRIGKFNMSVKHFHTEYEIFYLIRGEREFFLDNRSYKVTGGSLILVNENAIHMTRASNEEEEGHDRIILYIKKQTMKELDAIFPMIHLVQFFQKHYGVFHLNEEQQSRFLELYHELQEEFERKDRNSKAVISMKVLLYFVDFIRTCNISSKLDVDPDLSPKYKTVYAVSDYISEHYTEALSLETLASHFFVSKYYLCRNFKEITGYGINEYMHIHRIQKAKQLLEETSLTISQISEELGYESMTHFERTFKTYMTLSPLKYRKTLNVVTYTNGVLGLDQT